MRYEPLVDFVQCVCQVGVDVYDAAVAADSEHVAVATHLDTFDG
jgi:hypothetical protein